MATTKERIDGLETRLGRLEGASSGATQNTQVSATKRSKVWSWIKRNQAISVLGLFVAVASIWYPIHNARVDKYFDYRVDGRVDNKLAITSKKLDDLTEKVTAIGTKLDTLQPFIEDLVRRQMDSAAKLSSSELQRKLPAIKHVLDVATSQRVKMEPKTVKAVESKLATVPNRNDQFWQVGAGLISYRSLQDYASLAKLRDTMPRCTDSEPRPATSNTPIPKPGTYTIEINPALYENCKVILDDPVEDRKISLHAQREVNLTFRHCLVIYRGGIVVLQLGAFPIRFEDCLLDFSMTHTPPPSGQKITELLLARNLNSFTIPAI